MIQLPQWLSGKQSACNAGATGDTGLIPGSGTSPGEGYGNPLQYSSLENPMDRGASWATVHRIARSQIWLKRLSTHDMIQQPHFWTYIQRTQQFKDTCTWTFIAAYTQEMEKPKCPSTGMDKEEPVHLYNGMLFSHTKQWNHAICSNMDGPRDYHMKWSETEKDKHNMISLVCRI